MSSQPKWSLGCWAYEWNANGSLHKIKRADGKVFTFKYDAFGRRISKSYHRREFLYIWDGNVLLHEIKKDYQLEDQLTTWVFQDFIPVAKLQGDKSYSIISDHIGTPLVAIDNEGVKVWERELDIYGKVRKLQGDKWFMPFLYQGQYYDVETELAYNRFRYYSPDIGAYISQDPIGLEGGLALYSYVHDSNTWVDIFGLNPINLNSNNAVGNFGVYEIHIDDKLYKIGKADLGRVTKSSELPTRLHQQVRRLEKAHGKGNVIGIVVEDLGITTTEKAKIAETARLQAHYDETGKVPKGNERSFKPKKSCK